MDSIFDHPYMGRQLGMGIGGVTERPFVGQFSHVQIWRPSQSSARVAVSPIIISVTADATVRLGFASGGPELLVDNDGVKNTVDQIDLTQDLVQIRSETNVNEKSVIGPFLNFEVQYGAPLTIPGPLFFGSLQGITINPIVAGVGISAMFQWREGVVTVGLMV